MTILTREIGTDSIRDSIWVDPVRPKNIDEQTDESAFALTRSPKEFAVPQIEVATLLEVWEGAAISSTERTSELTELYPRSAAVWTRAAFSNLVIGKLDVATNMAKRALEVSIENEKLDGFLDVPAVAAAIRVLSINHGSEELTSFLEEIPRDAFLNSIYASLVASTGDLDKALMISGSVGTSEVAGLEGYLYLLKGNNSQAIQRLRQAVDYRSSDVDSYFNLAIALHRSNSLKKALRNIAIAFSLSPGRNDIREFYLDILAESRNWVALKGLVAKIRMAGSADSPELEIAEARLALTVANHQKALGHLKTAEQLAKDSRNLQLAAEMKSNILALSISNNLIGREKARRELLSLARSFPESPVILDLLCGLTIRRSESNELAKLVENHSESTSALAYSIRARFFYLQCDFHLFLNELRAWSARYPNDLNALAWLINAEGTFGKGWAYSAVLARKAVRKYPEALMILNQAAYSLSLANNAEEANQLLERLPKRNYLLEATMGLVKLSLGEISAGLKHYRNAAEILSATPDSNEDILLMSLYQGMALYRLGLVNDGNKKLLGGAALPNIPLPRDWADYPSYLYVKSITDQNGWPWPPLIS